jgi:hypothetical protein
VQHERTKLLHAHAGSDLSVFDVAVGILVFEMKHLIGLKCGPWGVGDTHAGTMRDPRPLARAEIGPWGP